MTTPRAPARRTARSFLFSFRVAAPLARLHLLTRLSIVLALSFVALHAIRTEAPDPLGAAVLLLLAGGLLHLGGALRWLFRSYLLVLFPALLVIALTWVVFNPDPGRGALLELALGPWTVVVSARNIAIAATKSLGYGALALGSLVLVTTTRDVELVGLLVQLRVPYAAVFFFSTMLRSLHLALIDYTTIRQAQIARGATLHRKNLVRRLADLARMAVPLTATMVRRASEVGDAALLRGFSLQTRRPTEFREARPLACVDWIAIGLCVLLAAAVLGWGLNLTRALGVAV